MEAVYGKLNIQISSHAWIAGLTWVLLTVRFEFILGYFILGSSVQSMLADYNLLEGRFWLLVLVSILVSPILYFKLGEHIRLRVRGGKRPNPSVPVDLADFLVLVSDVKDGGISHVVTRCIRDLDFSL